MEQKQITGNKERMQRWSVVLVAAGKTFKAMQQYRAKPITAVFTRILAI